jgi:hypothetical protein
MISSFSLCNLTTTGMISSFSLCNLTTTGEITAAALGVAGQILVMKIETCAALTCNAYPHVLGDGMLQRQ